MHLKEILNGRTIEDSDLRAAKAFGMARGLMHMSWIFTLGGQADIGVACFAAAVPIILEMKRQHMLGSRRRKEREAVFRRW